MKDILADDLVSICRAKISEVEHRMVWLQKHNFQEEVRILQVKVGGMFQIYDLLCSYKDCLVTEKKEDNV